MTNFTIVPNSYSFFLIIGIMSGIYTNQISRLTWMPSFNQIYPLSNAIKYFHDTRHCFQEIRIFQITSIEQRPSDNVII